MRYCTRENVHVDRCASAWLIKRFIDPQAKFVFVPGHIPLPDTIPFDMHGVEWGHHAGKCSFETIVSLHSINDPAVLQIARIIHGADITADMDETLESAGIDLVFRDYGSFLKAIKRLLSGAILLWTHFTPLSPNRGRSCECVEKRNARQYKSF